MHTINTGTITPPDFIPAKREQSTNARSHASDAGTHPDTYVRISYRTHAHTWKYAHFIRCNAIVAHLGNNSFETITSRDHRVLGRGRVKYNVQTC